MKPGIKSTEFWLAFITTVGNMLVQFQAIPADFPHQEAIAAIGNIIAVVVYIIARTKVKAAAGGGA